jgi:hypothetical protein
MRVEKKRVIKGKNQRVRSGSIQFKANGIDNASLHPLLSAL